MRFWWILIGLSLSSSLSVCEEMKCEEILLGLAKTPQVQFVDEQYTAEWMGSSFSITRDEASVLQVLTSNGSLSRSKLNQLTMALRGARFSEGHLTRILNTLSAKFALVTPEGYRVSRSFTGEPLQWVVEITDPRISESFSGPPPGLPVEEFPVAPGLALYRPDRMIYWNGQSFKVTMTQLQILLAVLTRPDSDPVYTGHQMMMERVVSSEQHFWGVMRDLLKLFQSVDANFNQLRRATHPEKGVGYYWHRENVDVRINVRGLPLQLGTNMVMAWWKGQPVEMTSGEYKMLSAMRSGMPKQANPEGGKFINKKTMERINQTFQNVVGADLLERDGATLYMLNRKLKERAE